MPSLATSTVVRDSTDGLHIALHARHVLVIDTPSDVVHTVKGRVPDDVDVILQSDLVITLSGTYNRANVAGRAMQISAITQHLLNFFHTNGEQLGLRTTSKTFLDEDDGNVKLTLTPTRPILERRSPYVRLWSIDLLYVCRASHPPPQSQAPGILDTSSIPNPFLPHAFLPLVAVLDRIAEKFVNLHLVRRYPLIFGPWRERFDAEMVVSAKVARALADIISRSPHPAFRKRCRRILKTLKKNDIAGQSASTATVHNLLVGIGTGGLEDSMNTVAQSESESKFEARDHTNILHQTMEHIFKYGLKPTRFKNVALAASGENIGTSVVDDFRLSECPAGTAIACLIREDEPTASGPVARERTELWFDEGPDAVGGSQDDDLVLADESELEDDMNISVSDEAESARPLSTPLEHSEDFWDSSQSTIDDPMLASDVLSLESSWSSTSRTICSDLPPRTAYHWDALMFDEEEDDLLDDLVHNTDEPNSSDCQLPCASSCKSDVSLLSPLDLAQSSPCLSDCAYEAPSDPGFLTVCPFLDEGLEATTSYLPLLVDGDPASYVDSSRSFYCVNPNWTRFPFEATNVPQLMEEGSSDGGSLSSPPYPRVLLNLQPPESLSEDQECSHRSVSVGSARRVIDRHEGNGGGDGGTCERNEGSLVARYACHATAIRPGQMEACMDDGAGRGRGFDGDAAEEVEMLFIE